MAGNDIVWWTIFFEKRNDAIHCFKPSSDIPLVLFQAAWRDHPDLRQFLATERPLKLMKNAFYFILISYFLFLFTKALFVLKVIKFLCWLFGHGEKRLD